MILINEGKHLILVTLNIVRKYLRYGSGKRYLVNLRGARRDKYFNYIVYQACKNPKRKKPNYLVLNDLNRKEKQEILTFISYK